jgi:fused signal recognition particle receptor
MSINTNPTPETQEQKQNDKELNFNNVRKSLETERLARQQAEARMAELERQMKESQRSHAKDEDDDDEPYVDHKKLTKKLASFEKNMEEKIDRKAEEKARSLLEQERQGSYLRENPDFQQVMSSDVVQKFADSHPRLAENILRMPEGFERQKLVYENIKALGLDKPKAKEPSVQEKIDANRRSPFAPAPGHAGPGYSVQGDFSESGQKSAYDKVQELKKRLRI